LGFDEIISFEKFTNLDRRISPKWLSLNYEDLSSISKSFFIFDTCLYYDICYSGDPYKALSAYLYSINPQYRKSKKARDIVSCEIHHSLKKSINVYSIVI